MSYYDDERSRRHRATATKSRRDDYDDDRDSYRNATSNTLVKRSRDDSVSSVEEIQRGWGPGEGGIVRETTVRKSGTRPARARSVGGGRPYSYNDYDDDSTYVSRRKSTRDHDRRSRRYSSPSSSGSSRSPRRRPAMRERRKSTTEKALDAVGLGGAFAAITGKKSRSSSRNRGGGRRRGSSSSQSKSRERFGKEQISQALKAAALAGVAEAVRARNEPGGWGGAKGRRILTAAVSAGGVDGLLDRDPNKHGTRHVVESALAGLATNRIVNGPRSKSRGRDNARVDSRGRARSESRGLKDLAAGGVLAAGAKSIYDRVRSKSRGREGSRGRARSRSSSFSSYDSRDPPPPRARSKSISDRVNAGLASLGIKSGNSRNNVNRQGGGRYDDDDSYYDDRRPTGYRGNSNVSRGPQSTALSTTPSGYRYDERAHHNGDPDTDSDSDLGSSSGEEQERKKVSRKRLITGGLAAVATIHAAHNVYQSIEKRDARKIEVATGEMSPEEARKKRNKARWQDAASIGIAALGIKGAYSEWKEMKETHEEVQEAKEKHERHAHKRAARREKEELMQRHGYNQSAPDLHSSYNPGGPMYYDGNPYGSSIALPPPPAPVGHQTSRYQPQRGGYYQ